MNSKQFKPAVSIHYFFWVGQLFFLGGALGNSFYNMWFCILFAHLHCLSHSHPSLVGVWSPWPQLLGNSIQGHTSREPPRQTQLDFSPPNSRSVLIGISKIEDLQIQLANWALLAVHPCRCTLHNQKIETYIFGFVCQVLAYGSKQHIDLQSKWSFHEDCKNILWTESAVTVLFWEDIIPATWHCWCNG